MPQFNLLISLITVVAVMAVLLGIVAYLVLAERKVAAWMQDRLGPNRVGPWGLLQPMADGLKMLLKEDIIPTHVDRIFYIIAPMVAAGTALLAFTVVPFGPTEPPPGPVPVTAEQPLEAAVATFDKQQAAYESELSFVVAPGIDIGFLLVFAIGSLAVYGIILGGWSSNNKYTLLGSLRSSAQIISYEIPLGLSILGVVLMAGSLNLERIIAWQVTNGWNVLFQPLAFLLFLTAVFAETNRLPFDLPEAEQELVGGFHTEYSSMKFGLFFLGEYAHMVTTSFLLAVFFFGGWHFPWLSDVGGILGIVLKFAILATKVAFFLMLFLMVRWTIPRFRFDQLMSLAWQVMIPLSLLNIVCVMVVRQFDLTYWILLGTSLLLFAAGALLSTRPPARPRPETKQPAQELAEAGA